jgi:hypothetical protein
MRFGIVEGEPGAFPDPIARILRFIGRLFGAPFRRRHRPDDAPDSPSSES